MERGWSVHPLGRGARVVPAQDFAVAGASLRTADGAELAHAAAVAPAAPGEQPALALPLDHEHPAVQISKVSADRQLAKDARRPALPRHLKTPRAAGDAATQHLERAHRAHVE